MNTFVPKIFRFSCMDKKVPFWQFLKILKNQVRLAKSLLSKYIYGGKGACEDKPDSEISTGAEKNNLSKDNNEKSESETNEDLDKKCQPLCPRYEAHSQITSS